MNAHRYIPMFGLNMFRKGDPVVFAPHFETKEPNVRGTVVGEPTGDHRVYRVKAPGFQDEFQVPEALMDPLPS